MMKVLSTIILLLSSFGIFSSDTMAADSMDSMSGNLTGNDLMQFVKEGIVFGFPLHPEFQLQDGYLTQTADESVESGDGTEWARSEQKLNHSEMERLIHQAFAAGEVKGYATFSGISLAMEPYEAIAGSHALGAARIYPDRMFHPITYMDSEEFAAYLARILNRELAGAKGMDKAERMLAGLSLNEKIGQLLIAGLAGTSLQEPDRQLLTENHVGGFIFFRDNLQTRQQAQQLVKSVKAANSGSEIPLLLSVDQEGGRVQRLPGVESTPASRAIGAKGETDYAYAVGQKLGRQVQSFGMNVDFAPVLDVDSNPANPVIGDRSFGNNAELVSRMGIAMMNGIASEEVIPVIKHFPGHGDTSVDSHIELPTVHKDLSQLEQLELIPFKEAITSGADAVMIAHILLPEIDAVYPASMSEPVINGILREQLDFRGVVMTDDMTMGAIANTYGIGEAAVRSIQAGSDIVLIAHDARNTVEAFEAIKDAVRSGAITMERIDESVLRIIRLKNHYLAE